MVAKEHVHGVFESIAEGYDAANDRISLGRHNAWKKELCEVALKACTSQDRAGLILDVCCGTGDIVEMLARNNPDVFVVGLDFSPKMLEVAHQRTSDLENVELVEGNAMALPFEDGTFDACVISFGLRNTPDYDQVISEMVRVTRPGGVVACLDASVPDIRAVRPFYQFYYKNIMTLLGGGLAHKGEYDWLYESTQEFLRKDELVRLFQDHGLMSVVVRPFMFGASALHVGVKPLFTSTWIAVLERAVTACNQPDDLCPSEACEPEKLDE